MRSHSTRGPSPSSTSGARVSPVVHDRVVPLAQQGGVRQIRRPTVCPVHEVMRVAPLPRQVAPRIAAVPVAQPQPLDLSGGEQPHLHTEVDHRTGGTEHRGDDRGVTRQPTHRLGRQQGTGLRPTHAHPAPRQPAAQGLQVDRDEQLRSWRTRGAARPRSPPPAAPTSPTPHRAAGRSSAGRAPPRPASAPTTDPNAASSTARPSGSRVSRYSASPSSSTRGCDNATNRFAAS